MQITIRPEPDCIDLIRSEFKKVIIGFLKSLGISENDAENWEATHTIAVKENDPLLIDVFDMKCYLSDDLLKKPEWELKFAREELFTSFIISGHVVCCQLLNTDGLKHLPKNILNLSCVGYDSETLNQSFEELKNLPSLKSISFKNCTKLNVISLLENLINLQSLDLRDCSSLSDISSLAGLNKLQTLNLSDCKSLTDISSFAGLLDLQSLNLSGCKSLTDISILSGLVNLQSLDLHFCESLTESSLAGLNKLQTLNLSSCYSLTKSSLVGLNNLQMLNLSNCASLREIGGLSGLLNLRSLDLGGCQSLSDISSLSGLYNLQTLDLGRCGHLVDISGLSGLVNLQWLELLYLSLSDISSLSGLVNLQSLNLSNCHSLTDISGLSGLVNLQALDLSSCISVTDISSLSGLLNLKWLDISLESQPLNMRFNGSREDISSLSGLVNLQSLNLSNCTSLSDISRLSGLVNLQSLDLYNCVSLTDISSLSGLLNLQSLNLSLCISVTDINSLAGLVKLQSLDLHYCKSLTDINSLSGLVKLQTLNLSDCKSLTDISSLAGLFNLQSLNLRDCESLTDISSLSGLVNLQSIDLSCCRLIVDINNLSGLFNLQMLDLSFDPLFKKSHEGLTEIKFLSGLINLQTLSLRYCHSISDISSLSGLLNLQSLNLEECKRIKSYLPLRDCLRLKDLNESKMHPAELTELLCFLAVQRKDIPYISKNASSWLKELKLGLGQKHSSTNDLACSLAQGIVLANLDEAGSSFHQTLLNHSDVGIAPWKTWFNENLKTHGWDKIQKLAELNQSNELTFGAIGGISSCLPSMEGDPAQINWAKKWISEIHSLHNNNPNFLKPAAAEWCLALKRLGEDELLREWIEKFTDPSDPSALDPINKVFSAYALDLNDSESALEYALKVNDPKLRDESILNLAQKFIKEGETTKAGDFLFLLTQIESRTQLAYSLAEDAAYLKSDENAHRLLAACGDSPESLASILDKLRLANPASEILKIMHEKLSDESRSEIPIETVVKECNSLAEFLIHTKDSSQLVRIQQAIESVIKSN